MPFLVLGLLFGAPAESEESPPPEDEESDETETSSTGVSKRCLASPWWPGTFLQGTYGWEHTRMTLPVICDCYWAAQTLSLSGFLRCDQFSIDFSGTGLLTIAQAYELLVYQPRYIETLMVGDGNYSVRGRYAFSQPLRWDRLDGTFCPEMALVIEINHNVSPDPPEELGFVTIDPSDGAECGTAYLMQGMAHYKELPLYYGGNGVLTGVDASAILTGARWVFD